MSAADPEETLFPSSPPLALVAVDPVDVMLLSVRIAAAPHTAPVEPPSVPADMLTHTDDSVKNIIISRRVRKVLAVYLCCSGGVLSLSLYRTLSVSGCGEDFPDEPRGTTEPHAELHCFLCTKNHAALRWPPYSVLAPAPESISSATREH